MNTNPVQSVQLSVAEQELVRGQEQSFIEELAPRGSRADRGARLCLVERIDAAGLAALITLYTDACKAGHTLTVRVPAVMCGRSFSSSASTASLLSRTLRRIPRFELQDAETAA